MAQRLLLDKSQNKSKLINVL
ncbi:MAG: hypothetical protein FD167_3890, partial [bacterium]